MESWLLHMGRGSVIRPRAPYHMETTKIYSLEQGMRVRGSCSLGGTSRRRAPEPGMSLVVRPAPWAMTWGREKTELAGRRDAGGPRGPGWGVLALPLHRLRPRLRLVHHHFPQPRFLGHGAAARLRPDAGIGCH